MQVHFVDSGIAQDLGIWEVDCHSFKMDADDAPYALSATPGSNTTACEPSITSTTTAYNGWLTSVEFEHIIDT